LIEAVGAAATDHRAPELQRVEPRPDGGARLTARVPGAPRLVDLWPRPAAMLARADRVIAHNVA
jgi:hypothetical protein